MWSDYYFAYLKFDKAKNFLNTYIYNNACCLYD